MRGFRTRTHDLQSEICVIITPDIIYIERLRDAMALWV